MRFDVSSLLSCFHFECFHSRFEDILFAAREVGGSEEEKTIVEAVERKQSMRKSLESLKVFPFWCFEQIEANGHLFFRVTRGDSAQFVDESFVTLVVDCPFLMRFCLVIWWSTQKDESKRLGEDQALRTSTLIRPRPNRGEGHIDFLGESEGSFPQIHDSFPNAGEAMNDFGSMSGSFICPHHVEPRVKLYSPREESFPIPLKCIDVTRTTHTNLDVKQEKRIDDYWNIDGSRNLSDPWTGFTQFILLDEKLPDGYTWSGGRLTRKQFTSRPDHLRPEHWK